MRILAIETSCDETAAAIVEDGRRALADVISTQIDIHRRWGGVVPELASRNHVVQVMPVVDEALSRAGVGPDGLDAIAVTSGPGLVGALLVGVQAAKALALAWQKPLVRVNHLEGHLVAAFLSETAPAFPYLGLVVSGGHTSLYAAHGFGDYRLLGQTRDDAAGEAFDKGAKLLGLPYPGGVAIDRLAKEGDARAIRFPKAIVKGADLDFSFSGLKTALLHHVKKHGLPEGKGLADLCASYQEAIVRALVEKAFRAARRLQYDRLVLSGGVAANSRLRGAVAERAREYEGMEVFLPAPRLCTDNAAMIAVAGTHAFLRGERAGADLNADPAWRL
ncbi:tRNA (adenosine(37)-N6)-threonylcarbamoyltransferase complex transferase subunit TsaD [Anaeromyxobacter sp. Fw109-5]|uniref:tRNA N6-adenosine threonylcarbamoyltransferase n=1 Tax=Anaeromyxobacter sp. (strain Fw109-5) TaxID=404589 RepID=TSAD_ANADF|nr:tRNA (adenosine(37)-N6)-threonylcarbamoyltransferase complex transferase subunit TsaD [Anaeromyxobacter sp. Fw109-5]A7HGZ6.1 RecName: Full=tRNA N6-adenosine threonylcarbamoyltransferase; AltName: Full=N6-L-threonylcarbamoyladenine synthase; Short=t(6)A synthase; AltName: Full=t(6)A37 threonylcarbamoyladenosine biosynthesis protein TsaD; AltName: Full=tRNA threonylcarbamoyladenosine biosynthesis protein TsaD [Anaeromyxobacter sp. Fw109-5]ABS27992.1 putative metalloendopeptidase, glycoprotease f